MMRVIVGLILLCMAVVLVAFSGGVDVMSVSGWATAKSGWSLPAASDNVKCLVLLAGLLVLMLAVARLLTPGGKVKPVPRIEA